MDMPRREDEANERGEYDERHHPWLHERDIITDAGNAGLATHANAVAPHAPREIRAFAHQRHQSDTQFLSDKPSTERPPMDAAAVTLSTAARRIGGTAAARAASIPASWRPRPRGCRRPSPCA